jgi:alanine racemase
MTTFGIVGPGVGTTTCNSIELALSGDFVSYATTWNTHAIALVGLAPDGNTTVSVTYADGTTRQVSVADNVYLIMGGDPTSITLHDASGTLTTLEVP